MNGRDNNIRVKQEKLSFRDLRFSQRHRQWGNKLYMMDMDCIEFNSKLQSVAVIELKHGQIKQIERNSFQNKCYLNTASKLNIPFFIVIYYPTEYDEINKCENQFSKYWQAYVIPMETESKKVLPEPRQMSERDYVRLMYHLRGDVAPDGLLDGLDAEITEIPLPTII